MEAKDHSRPEVEAKLQKEVLLDHKLAKVGRTKARIRMMEKINKRKMMRMRPKKVKTVSIINLMWKSQPQPRAILRVSLSKRGIKKLRKPLSSHSKYLWIVSQILVY